MNIKSILSRVKKAFGNKKAFGFVNSGIKAIIAVVIGGVLLGGTYALNHDVIMPTSTNRIIRCLTASLLNNQEAASKHPVRRKLRQISRRITKPSV